MATIKAVRVLGRRLTTANDLNRSVKIVGRDAVPEHLPSRRQGQPKGRIEDVLLFLEEDNIDTLSIGHEADGTLTIHYGGFVHEIRDGALWTRV